MVIATPEIKSFRIAEEHDFIVIASDGIFDKLSNQEAIECVWNSVRDVKSANIHQQAGLGVEYIIKNALLRRTLDNVTVVVVSFENFQRVTFGQSSIVPDDKDLSLGNATDPLIKKRNPQMNNTHTSGLIKDNRKIFTGLNGSGIVGGLATLNSGNNYRSGLSTPTSKIMERGLRSHNNSLEESKLSESHANVTLGGPSTGNISLLNAGHGN